MKRVVFSKKYNSNFELFLKFMANDSRIPDGYRWSQSIKDKCDSVTLRHEEVLEQIKRCSNDMDRMKKELDEIGYADSGIECPKLAYKYEDFLNSIYALFENVSKIVAYLYPKNSLPLGFHDQKKRFLNRDIDLEYTEILKQTPWYDEVQSLRSESIHFLSGMVMTADGEPGYFNIPKSSRNGAPNKIKIESIKNHIDIIYKNVGEFIILFGNHFINVLDQELKAGFPCVRMPSGLIGVEERSLYEYLNNLPGRCVWPKLDCPLKDSCIAKRAIQ